jgi:hypothetical protein
LARIEIDESARRDARADGEINCVSIANFTRIRQHRSMPTVMRIGPYRFHFYSRENNESPHIHVTREEMEAKFWLRPVSLAGNHGFARAELNRIEKLVEEHCQKLLEGYIAYHGN